MNTASKAPLASLNALEDYRVCADDSDPRGWHVVDTNGLPLGTITDLVIDPDALLVRYLVCAVTSIDAGNVLIPVGFARLADDERTAYLDFVTADAVNRLPQFGGFPLEPGLIEQTEQALTGVAPAQPQNAKIVRRSDAAADAS